MKIIFFIFLFSTSKTQPSSEDDETEPKNFFNWLHSGIDFQTPSVLNSSFNFIEQIKSSKPTNILFTEDALKAFRAIKTCGKSDPNFATDNFGEYSFVSYNEELHDKQNTIYDKEYISKNLFRNFSFFTTMFDEMPKNFHNQNRDFDISFIESISKGLILTDFQYSKSYFYIYTRITNKKVRLNLFNFFKYAENFDEKNYTESSKKFRENGIARYLEIKFGILFRQKGFITPKFYDSIDNNRERLEELLKININYTLGFSNVKPDNLLDPKFGNHFENIFFGGDLTKTNNPSEWIKSSYCNLVPIDEKTYRFFIVLKDQLTPTTQADINAEKITNIEELRFKLTTIKKISNLITLYSNTADVDLKKIEHNPQEIANLAEKNLKLIETQYEDINKLYFNEIKNTVSEFVRFHMSLREMNQFSNN